MISDRAYVDPSAKIGENVTIHPFAFIDKDVVIGDNCEIMPYVSINGGTRIGNNNKIYQGAIIGADPQDFRWKGQQTYCYIGNNNIIREDVLINRGIDSTGGTRIGDDCFIMAKCHIGHDTQVLGKTVLGNSVVCAGDVTIGQNTILSSAVILHEGSHVGEWVLIKGGCRITGNVPPYVIMAHNPAAYFGINAKIMAHEGFTQEEINQAARAYRHIYQSATSVFNALQNIEADIEDCPVRANILGFVRNHNLKLVAVPLDIY